MLSRQGQKKIAHRFIGRSTAFEMNQDADDMPEPILKAENTASPKNSRSIGLKLAANASFVAICIVPRVKLSGQNGVQGAHHKGNRSEL